MIRVSERKPLSRLELLQIHSAEVSPIKRNIKITNQKFPPGFFPHEERLLASKMMVSRALPQTHHELRSSNLRIGNRKREMSTALEYRDEKKDVDEELILGVISTARQMRRIIRKHSTELKKGGRERKASIELELPTIIKRGNTTAF